MTLTTRKIDLKFELNEGSFSDAQADSNAVTISGLRASATISKPGGVSLSSLDLKVRGMTLSQMNQLSTLGKPIASVRKNTVTVTAGDDESGMAVVFVGTIMNAWVDGNAAPDVSFNVSAMTGAVDRMKPVAPSSYKGPTDVAVIMKSLADQMGYSFENSGVTGVIISSPYLPGTALDQAQRAARAANINVIVDGTTLAIWPADGQRGGEIPLISAETGMVGYPTHTENGIALTAIYNPNVVFGGRVQVKSILIPSAGEWTVFSVTHELESELPGGKWFTHMECAKFGNSSPIK